MQFLHTMVRVSNLEQSLDFYCNALGLSEVYRKDSETGRFTLVFLAAQSDLETVESSSAPVIELTYNWDPEEYNGGRNFGHLAYRVDNIYQTCEKLMAAGVVINRPPRDGHMAFVRSPDNISIELLQRGDSLPAMEPWVSMDNNGDW
jgi:lactoylglutathione lyase